MKTLSWKKGIPKKPGIYLRNNPPASQIVRQDLYLIDGELCTSGEGLSATRMKNWKGAKTMWWFGPIPRPPEGE